MSAIIGRGTDRFGALSHVRENKSKDAKLKRAVPLTSPEAFLYFAGYDLRATSDRYLGGFGLLDSHTRPGARFPGEMAESPERAEASAPAPSGFLIFVT